MIMVMETTAEIGQRLARNLDLIRQARGLSADAFARESGATRQLVSLWRTGRHSPSLGRLAGIAGNLGKELSALLAKEPSEVLRGEE